MDEKKKVVPFTCASLIEVSAKINLYQLYTLLNLFPAIPCNVIIACCSCYLFHNFPSPKKQEQEFVSCFFRATFGLSTNKNII